MILKLRVDSVSRKFYLKVLFYYLSCNKFFVILDCVIVIYFGWIYLVIVDVIIVIMVGLRNVIVWIVCCIIICFCIKCFGFLVFVRIVF